MNGMEHYLEDFLHFGVGRMALFKVFVFF